MPECLRRYTPLGLLFNQPTGESGGENGGGGGSSDPTDLGFPKDTSVTDMTAEQQAAYWKHHARKHEATAKAREKFDQYKADSEALALERQKNQTDQERAVEEARRQGEANGSTRYLKDAVAGHLRGVTHKSAEDIKTALEFVDVKAFTSTDGALDLSKIDTFAKQLGVTPEQQQKKGPSLFETAARGNGNGAPRTGTSLADKRKATREALTPTRS